MNGPVYRDAYTADAPDWPGYVNAQGGPFVTRDCLRVRLNYEYTENGNDYGDTVAKISGVYCPFTISESVIYTRTTDDKIVPKRKLSPVENLTLEGRDAAPWSSVNNCTGNIGTDKKSSAERTGVPLNIEDLRRYPRQQRQEITCRLRNSLRESSDQAFARTTWSLQRTINDEAALLWGPKVAAAKYMNLTQCEAKLRWREQLRIEAEKRADSYIAASVEYKKKGEAILILQNNGTAIHLVQKSALPEIRISEQKVHDDIIGELD